MKIFLSFFTVLLAGTSIAQTTAADVKVERYFNEVSKAATASPWAAKLYGPTLFIDPNTRETWANEADSAGILKPQGKIFKGILPGDVMVANTAITWQGKRWSVVLWPLPEDKETRMSLILHESFHRIQAQLGLPVKDPTTDHLSTLNGRIYFFLELRALAAALNKPVNQRVDDLRHALFLRERREKLFPVTFNNESVLEMNEGVAEYTGVLLGRAKSNVKRHLTSTVNEAPDRQSLIRSSAYLTGPLYGYLLYEKDPKWTLRLNIESNFPKLIMKYYGIRPSEFTDELPDALIRKYDGETLIAAEKKKDEARQQLIAGYIETFTGKPVLRIEQVKMNINFNPNTLTDLGEHGKLYPTGAISDVWGKLEVESGGLLLKDWMVITLPAEVLSQNGPQVNGKGWKLVLNPGWKLQRSGENYGLVRM